MSHAKHIYDVYVRVQVGSHIAHRTLMLWVLQRLPLLRRHVSHAKHIYDVYVCVQVGSHIVHIIP